MTWYHIVSHQTRSCQLKPNRIITYHITSHHAISCRIISCQIIPYDNIAHRAVPYRIIPSHINSYNLYHIMSYHMIPCHNISYHIIPSHTISYHIVPYHIPPYHVICLICENSCVIGMWERIAGILKYDLQNQMWQAGLRDLIAPSVARWPVKMRDTRSQVGPGGYDTRVLMCYSSLRVRHSVTQRKCFSDIRT